MTGLRQLRMISHGVVRLAVGHGGGGQPTNGRQDKSRSLFAERSAADGRKINDLARGAFLSRDVHFCRTAAKIDASRTSHQNRGSATALSSLGGLAQVPCDTAVMPR